MTHVYIVCKGEFAEGHDPVGVRSSYLKACRLLHMFMPDARVVRVTDSRWKAAKGVDEIWIYRMAVDL